MAALEYETMYKMQLYVYAVPTLIQPAIDPRRNLNIWRIISI
jgi:hypothetical protein